MGETFKIVHTGSMHVDQGRRHAKTQRLRQRLGEMPVPGTTFTSRSHTYLVQAVRALTRSDPELARELELHFAGPVTTATGRSPRVSQESTGTDTSRTRTRCG